MRGVREVIDELLAVSRPITTQEVAARAGVSRQAAQKQLKAYVAAGVLTVEGRARRARYLKRQAGPDLWAKVDELSKALAEIVNPPRLTIQHAQARLSRMAKVEVAKAGSQFRLSARLLLEGVDCDVLVLDFGGVQELGDEFVEEVFVKWAQAHPLTKLEIVNLQETLISRLPVTGR